MFLSRVIPLGLVLGITGCTSAVRLIREAAHLGGHAVLFDISSMTRVGGDESERLQPTGKVIVYADSTQPH